MPKGLDLHYDFSELSIRDLLEARDLYHFHLMSKANVVGTAIGYYLIRKEEEWPRRGKPSRKLTTPRTLANSEVRNYSWPAVLVLVDQWLNENAFSEDGRDHPTQIVPKTLFMPDGRAVPVCVVAVEPLASRRELAAGVHSWPHNLFGGGMPIFVDVQETRHVATVGCLVSDGHLTYALTARHACGPAETTVYSRLRSGRFQIGKSVDRQLTRLPFSTVYAAFPQRQSYMTLDVGLVELDDVNAWTSNIYGLPPLGPMADIYEQNLTLALIDQPVLGFGAASGFLRAEVKALFYRYRSVGGFDYVGDFLIAPESGGTSTSHGDSGMVWHLDVTSQEKGRTKPLAQRDLRPFAIEWGGQTFDLDGTRSNFAVATSLSNVCKLLDVELVNDRNRGVSGYWGRTGHYSIATFAIPLVKNPKLKKLLEVNAEALSFDQDVIAQKNFAKDDAKAEFVRLADVADDVWKHFPASHKNGVEGGRDVRPAEFRSTGPEHPNHYADIDIPYKGGKTLRQLCLEDASFLTVPKWQEYYRDLASAAKARGDRSAAERAEDPFRQGLLPFRVWQIFAEMIEFLSGNKADLVGFVTAAGILAHYVGDGSQPLHGSEMSDGDQNRPVDGRFDRHGQQLFYGSGAHSAFESDMLDVIAGDGDLMPAVSATISSDRNPLAPVRSGSEAALAIVKLMEEVATTLPPEKILDAYEGAGAFGTKRMDTRRAMWQRLGPDTAKVIGKGAEYLAILWDSAFAVGRGDRIAQNQLKAFDPDAIRALYIQENFLQSYTLDEIGPVLGTQAVPSSRRRK